MKKVKSGMIKEIGYNSKEKTLDVVFTNGTHWKYSNVPSELYRELESSESIGKFFFKNIKSKFGGEKVIG